MVWYVSYVRVLREHDFAELIVDRRALEEFSNERSAYYNSGVSKVDPEEWRKLSARLKWHISRSLSERQKEVISLYLKGKKEREIADKLGVTQQVVNIYKWRAIRKLQRILFP